MTKYRDLTMRAIFVLTCLLMTPFISGCSDEKHTKNTSSIQSHTSSNETQAITQDSRELLSAFINSTLTVLEENKHLSTKLQAQCSALANTPTEDNLHKAQNTLSYLHDYYLQTTLMRSVLSSTNIEHPTLDIAQTTPPVRHTIHSRIDQQPLIAGYIDSVQGYPNSGLIHSDIELTAENLNLEHQFSDPNYVAIGLHALAYALNGDKKEHKRLHTHFLTQSTAKDTPSDITKLRRSQYIKILSQLLASDITRLYKAWSNKDSYYINALLSKKPLELETIILRAIEQEQQTIDDLRQQLSTPKSTNNHDSERSVALRQELIKRILFNSEEAIKSKTTSNKVIVTNNPT